MKLLILLATGALALAATKEDCEDATFFIANKDDCLDFMRKPARTTVVETTEVVAESTEEMEIPEGFVEASDEDKKVNTRSADLSGCGIHRTCTACRDMSSNKCYWNPGTGCIIRFNNMQSTCTAATNVAPLCSAFTDCHGCTTQNGCIFFKGTCTYSRGTGCESDPLNCINYSWNCPSKPSQNVIVPQYSNPLTPPAPSIYATVFDRVAETVDRIEDMIVGMTRDDLRRLRIEVDSLITAAERVAVNPTVYNTQTVYTFNQPQTSARPQVSFSAYPSQYYATSSQFGNPINNLFQQQYAPNFVTPSVSASGYSTSFTNSQFQQASNLNNPFSAVRPQNTNYYG